METYLGGRELREGATKALLKLLFQNLIAIQRKR